MRFHSLASSSAGNCYLAESAGQALMIDCGIPSMKRLLSRLASAGVSPAGIVGIVFTHDHGDHVQGLCAFHRKFPEIPLFANMMTAEAIAARAKVPEEDFIPFENSQPFTAGAFEIAAFSIPHDVPDPVGFTVRAENEVYFHATDIGTPLDSIGVHLADADWATLESNHDSVLLARSDRTEMLKRRIRGPRGHLSNDQTAGLVRRFATPRLKAIRLAHLSLHCNEPHLALGATREALAAAGLAAASLDVLPADALATWGGEK